MELGNLVFGHSRGAFPIPERYEWLTAFEPLLEAAGLNSPYGFEEMDGAVTENDVFVVRAYWWGDCTCGFDDREFDEPHAPGCYQVALAQAQEKLSPPPTWSRSSAQWIAWAKAEKRMYESLCARFGLPTEGWGVHCTCDYEERYAAWLRRIGYPEGHRADCALVLPNFEHKPSGFNIRWYKYAFRDAYMSHDLSLEAFKGVVADCVASLRAPS